MKKKIASGIVLTLLLMDILTLTFNIELVFAAVSPYIAVVPGTTVDPALAPGMNYTISINTDYDGNDVWGFEFKLTFNPNVLEGIEVVNGDLITEDVNTTMWVPGTFDNTAGTLSLTGNVFFKIGLPKPVTSGPGTLANMTFGVVGRGSSNITLETQGPERTKLIGYTEGGHGTRYNIIDPETMPDHIQHGFFSNVLGPNITDVFAIPPAPNYNEEVTVTATITDDTTVDEVLLSYTSDAIWHNVSMIKLDETYYETIPAQPYASLVQYKIYANDTDGNWAESEIYSYTVDDFVAPEVDLSQIPDYPQSTQTVRVYANVSEPEDASGIEIVAFSYRVNGGSWWNTTMDFNADLGLYERTIPTQQPNDTVEYFVEAQDYAENLNLSETFSYVVTLGGDVDYDFDVDYDDFVAFAGRYGCDFYDPLYKPSLDLNSDGNIDYDDFIILAGNYGETL